MPVIELLMSNGAMIDVKDKYGWTPLHKAAAFKGQEEAAICLLDHAADVNAKDNKGFTPLLKKAISLLSTSLSSVELISI